MSTLLFIGLGRIGLPQALIFSQKQNIVYGYDASSELIGQLEEGAPPFYEKELEKYLATSLGKSFFILNNLEKLKAEIKSIDAVFFAIGTSAVNAAEAVSLENLDLGYYFDLIDVLFDSKNELKLGAKLIFRTTFPLGTTDRIKEHIEKKYNLKESRDFYLAFIPERIVAGNAIQEGETLPHIIGAYTDKAYVEICSVFEGLDVKKIRVTNPLTAEFCKLTDNSFRNTLFSYANELAMYAGHLNIDALEVINTVNFHYPRNNIPDPAFVSGYCLSKDPYIFELNFLKYMAQRDFSSIWYYGRRTNDYMITYAVQKVLKHVKDPKTARVLLLGVAFKEDTDDFRMSHAIQLMNALVENQVTQFSVYDPFLDTSRYTELPKEIQPYIRCSDTRLTDELFSDVDAIIMTSKHREICALKREVKRFFLSKAKPSCYLLDTYDIWNDMHDFSHIRYESFRFPINETLKKEADE